MTDIDSAKAAFRAAARTARRAAATDADAPEKLRDSFVDGIALPAGPLAGYWPFGDELDPRPLLRHAHADGRTLALPVCGPRGTPLTFRRWTPGAPLAPGRYGIAEPGPEAPAVVPAALLIPLLAFDRAGRRLGYGAGYYDRTLASLRTAGPVLAIGVAYAAQEVERVPAGIHDELLDWIVTETGAICVRPVGD